MHDHHADQTHCTYGPVPIPGAAAYAFQCSVIFISSVVGSTLVLAAELAAVCRRLRVIARV